MSRARTQPTASAKKRDVLKNPQQRGPRETRAETMAAWRPLLEYEAAARHPKWCVLHYGGEFRAG